MPKSEAKQFEDRIKNDQIYQRNYCYQIPTGARFIGRKSIPHKSGFDFMSFDGSTGTLYCFDAKVSGERFNFKSKVMADHKSHQYHALAAACEYPAVEAGYLNWFTEEKKIAWLSIETLQKAMDEGVKSVSAEDLPHHPEQQVINLKEIVR